jgi:SAM-dependent methyltransferase
MGMNPQNTVPAKDAARKFGDFTGLASNYSKFRPHYSDTVLNLILSLFDKPAGKIDAADLGAGTGLWTRMLARKGLNSVVAVEPNDDMRAYGESDSSDLGITWKNGSGEQTGLPDQSVDLVTAASCFHWFDFNIGTQEISRILRPRGHFVALWNPRYIQSNPLLVEIENKMFELVPTIKRVSSGRSAFTDSLFDRLAAHELFENVIYLEGRHTQIMTPEAYIGAWRSVNDIQVQMGSKAFEEFMSFVEKKVSDQKEIHAEYQTRAWVAKSSK